jgi:hypothetical protein
MVKFLCFLDSVEKNCQRRWAYFKVQSLLSFSIYVFDSNFVCQIYVVSSFGIENTGKAFKKLHVQTSTFSICFQALTDNLRVSYWIMFNHTQEVTLSYSLVTGMEFVCIVNAVYSCYETSARLTGHYFQWEILPSNFTCLWWCILWPSEWWLHVIW